MRAGTITIIGCCLALSLVGGCRSQFSSHDDGETGETGDGDGSSDGESGESGDGGGCEDEDQTMSDDCPADRPFCLEQECVSCAALPVDTCANADPEHPACDPESGACVECTDVKTELCTGDTPVCGELNQCVGCTANDQCATGSCLANGQCLLEEIVMTGVVYRYGQLNELQPRSDAQVSVRNIVDIPNPPVTDVDGIYELGSVPPFSLVQLSITAPHDDIGFNIPASLRTVVSTTVKNDSPVELNLPVVSYGWLSEVAYECGIFDTLEEAQGNGAVNTYFTQRSTVLGRLVDEEGEAVQGISKFGIQIGLDARNNVHGGTEDPNDNPATVCFLEKGPDGVLNGTTNPFSGTSGHFVMFRIQDEQGTGSGIAAIKAGGFDPVTVKIGSTGEIGVVELVRNGEEIARDFETEVYPVFTSHGCVGCHFPGGVAYNQAPVRDGYHADWSGTPDEVYEHLTGPGTDCVDPEDPNDPGRVCTNDPPISLLITRPLAEGVNEPDDAHPVDIFPSIDDPVAIIFREWIEQGAERGQSQDPVDFTEDIYPLFTEFGCVGCHNPGSQVFDDIPERDGFVADWSAEPMEVWMNLTGPGTTCMGVMEERRICTDTPTDALIVTRPLTDPPQDPDPHPVDIFESLEDPEMKLIVRWLTEGAKFEP